MSLFKLQKNIRSVKGGRGDKDISLSVHSFFPAHSMLAQENWLYRGSYRRVTGKPIENLIVVFHISKKNKDQRHSYVLSNSKSL